MPAAMRCADRDVTGATVSAPVRTPAPGSCAGAAGVSEGGGRRCRGLGGLRRHRLGGGRKVGGLGRGRRRRRWLRRRGGRRSRRRRRSGRGSGLGRRRGRRIGLRRGDRAGRRGAESDGERRDQDTGDPTGAKAHAGTAMQHEWAPSLRRGVPRSGFGSPGVEEQDARLVAATHPRDQRRAGNLRTPRSLR